MVKAHGGSKMLQSVEGGGSLLKSGIVSDTKVGAPKDVHMKGLSRLVSNTTGVPRGEVVMEGVLKSTIPADRRDTPEYSKVPSHEQGKTKAKRLGQVPYAGRQY